MSPISPFSLLRTEVSGLHALVGHTVDCSLSFSLSFSSIVRAFTGRRTKRSRLLWFFHIWRKEAVSKYSKSPFTKRYTTDLNSANYRACIVCCCCVSSGAKDHRWIVGFSLSFLSSSSGGKCLFQFVSDQLVYREAAQHTQQSLRWYATQLWKYTRPGTHLSPTYAVSATVFHSFAIWILCLSMDGAAQTLTENKQKNKSIRRRRGPIIQCVFLVSGMALDTL